MSTGRIQFQSQTLFGHPTGLFTLFFAEMWERFSYYGMRALLLFYMLKGFLGYGDSNAYAVYGAYTALVYMTPFFGGMIADRLLGSRRAVILGGILMAAGHLMMTVESEIPFFVALALLIAGNGFFKPNISTIVGSLYPEGSPKRDGGFTIFYMGINLGAAMSPLLCGYIGETYGWHVGFGLATIGMLTGVAVFVAPSLLAQISMSFVALLAAVNIVIPFTPDWLAQPLNIQDVVANWADFQSYVNIGVLVCLALAGIVAFVQIGRGKLEESVPSKFLAGLIIVAGAVAAAASLWLFRPTNAFSIAINVLVAVALLIAAVVACVALAFGGLPKEAGAAPDEARLRKRVAGVIPAEWLVYLGTLLCIPILIIFVSGFGPLTKSKQAISIVPNAVLNSLNASDVLQGQAHVLQKALEKKNDKAVARINRRMKKMNESGTLIDAHYQKLKESVDLATNQKWDEAKTTLDATEKRFPRESMSIILSTFLKFASTPAGLILFLTLIIALGYLGFETFRMEKIARERMFVVLILTFFSMLFWAFFEQAGSSVNNFTDRNVDRVMGGKTISDGDVGSDKTFRIPPETDEDEINKYPLLSQEQLGKSYGNEAVKKQIANAIRAQETKKRAPNEGDKLTSADKQEITDLVDEVTEVNVLTMTGLTYLREQAKGAKATKEDKLIKWEITQGNVGMNYGGSEVPASVFQSLNPIYILLFGIAFSALWTFLGTRRLEPSTPFKFSLGLLQLGLGFGAIWYGAQSADGRGMVSLNWLFLGYLLHTTGELCLSPVGLSMVTKLSPMRLVSTVMGMWFLATAFSQLLAGIIAQFTGVGHGGGGQEAIPAPVETVDTYGQVFGIIAITALISAAVCFILSPLLTYWMHSKVGPDEDSGAMLSQPGPEQAEERGQGFGASDPETGIQEEPDGH